MYAETNIYVCISGVGGATLVSDAFNNDLSSWVVTQVTDMSKMFKGAALFNNGD